MRGNHALSIRDQTQRGRAIAKQPRDFLLQ